MKYLLPLVALFSVMIFSEESRDHLLEAMIFNCVVQDQTILEIKDGKAKRYSSYEGGYENGDSQKITITLEAVVGDDVISEQILGLKFPDKMTSNFYGEANHTTEFVEDEIEKFPISLEGGYFNEKLMISENAIVGDDFVFKRYYKNDWDLRVTDKNWTMVSNCMKAQTDVSVLIKNTTSFVQKSFKGKVYFD